MKFAILILALFVSSAPVSVKNETTSPSSLPRRLSGHYLLKPEQPLPIQYPPPKPLSHLWKTQALSEMQDSLHDPASQSLLDSSTPPTFESLYALAMHSSTALKGQLPALQKAHLTTAAALRIHAAIESTISDGITLDALISELSLLIQNSDLSPKLSLAHPDTVASSPPIRSFMDPRLDRPNPFAGLHRILNSDDEPRSRTRPSLYPDPQHSIYAESESFEV